MSADFSLSDLLKDAKDSFHTWYGLLASILSLLTLESLLSFLLAENIRTILVHVLGGLTELDFKVLEVLYYLIPVCILSLIWHRKRQPVRFATDKIGIIFSSSNPTELQEGVSRLKGCITEELKRHDLFNLFEIKTLPANHKISHVQDAFTAIGEADGKLLIWGQFQSGLMEGRRYSGFANLNFTYRHPSNVTPSFKKEIESSLLNRQWAYSEKNEFVENRVVAHHIAQVALYIIGLTLLPAGDPRRAETILSPLDESLDHLRRAGSSSPLAHFCAQVRRARVDSISLLVGKDVGDLLWRRGLFKAEKEELGHWSTLIEKAIELDSQDSRLYCQKAFLMFLKGSYEESLKAAKKAKKLAPRADPIPDFALAFLKLYVGEVSASLKHYRAAFARKGSSDLVHLFEIQEYIRQVLENQPHKVQLRYAIAMIHDERLDAATAKEEYVLFLKESSSLPNLILLRELATNRLDALGTIK